MVKVFIAVIIFILIGICHIRDTTMHHHLNKNCTNKGKTAVQVPQTKDTLEQKETQKEE